MTFPPVQIEVGPLAEIVGTDTAMTLTAVGREVPEQVPVVATL